MYMELIMYYTITVEYIYLFSSHDGAKMAVIELPINALAPMPVTAFVKHTLDRGASDG